MFRNALLLQIEHSVSRACLPVTLYRNLARFLALGQAQTDRLWRKINTQYTDESSPLLTILLGNKVETFTRQDSKYGKPV